MSPLIVVQIITQIISSVPEAIDLWKKIMPLIGVKDDIHPETVAEIKELAAATIPVVEHAHKAIAMLVDSHAVIKE
jgi:hypothetical protein